MSTNTKKYVKSVDALVDTAFVPNEVEEVVINGERTRPSAEKLWADFLSEDSEVISAPFKVDAKSIKNGEHSVKVYDITPHQSKDASQPDYVVIELADEKTRYIWSTLVSMDKSFSDWLFNINMFNLGIVNGLTRAQAIQKLQTKAFRVWTVQDKDKRTGNVRVYTYVDKEKYERRCYAMKMNESREGKDPWED